ncbi:C163A protein, partial [Nothocercus nigrocapillus]|nr:C163A protein [Nothocercus nigrocapillus]
QLRLVNGAGPCEGRVEVKLQDQWGTVADDTWDMEDAEAVCQQLGCGSAKSAHISTRFGKGSGPIHLAMVDCRGDESALWECTILGWGPYKGPHDWDVGVICQGFVRLVSGDGTCSGRVEVRKGQEWATLCEAHMDLNAANVICKELGCGAALAVTSVSHFGSGDGPIWDGGFECAGNESLLSACARTLPHDQACTHDNDTGIICSRTGELRLVDGGSRCAGRVEVKHEGQWGSVCSYDFSWDVPAASVVCRQLGCGTVAKASPHTPFGAGTGPIWLQPLHCRGTETALHNCFHLGWGQHFCDHDTDVGVTCSGAVELRLMNGAGPCEGRVEVKLRGQWGTVADDTWNMEDAEVVCQQLGCGSAKSAHISTRFGQGSGPIQIVWTHCRGNESALWECNNPGWGPYKGRHDWDVGVICQGFVRLVGGDSTCSGRVEVRKGQEWATLCEAHMDLNTANVICKELGCGAALAIQGAAHFGSGDGPIWDGGFECAGNESLLSACARTLPHDQACTHDNDTGIICSPYTDFRLVNGSTACAGRVEMEVRGTWRSLCDTGWHQPDAQVLCHQLGCGFVTSVPRAGYFGAGSGPLWRHTFHCSGVESHLGACPATALGIPACAPGNSAAVNCSGGCRVESINHKGLVLGGQPAAKEVVGLPSSPTCHEDIGHTGTPWRSRRTCRIGQGTGRALTITGLQEHRQGEGSGAMLVCANGTSAHTAAVVCRQLGCGTGGRLASAPENAWGSGPAWLSWVKCVPGTGSLWHC